MVKRADRVTVPLGPPMALGMAKRRVRGVLEEEVNMVDTQSCGVGAIGIGGGQVEVHGNEVPAGRAVPAER